MSVTKTDLKHLRRALELAHDAQEHGDEPFGSLLVAADGTVLFEDHNRVKDGDALHHPELEISRWATRNLTPEQRAAATVYTSGEHCPMCAASHGWVGLGRIVFVSSGLQLAQWLAEWGVPAGPVAPLPINMVVPSAVVEGPIAELEAESRALYQAHFAGVN